MKSWCNNSIIKDISKGMLDFGKNALEHRGDSLLIDIPSMVANSKYEEVMINSMADYIQREYRIKSALNKAPYMTNKLISYYLLYNSLCYVITPEYVDTDGTIIKATKELYTCSQDVIEGMYYEDFLTCKDIKDDISIKVSKCINKIKDGKKIIESLNTVTGVYGVRFDKAYHIDEDMRMHYIPVCPNSFIDLNMSVIIPVDAYNVVTKLMYDFLDSNLCFISSGRRGLFTTNNRDLLSAFYDKDTLAMYDRYLREKSNTSDERVFTHVLGISKYEEYVPSVAIESIDRVEIFTKYTKSILETLRKGESVTCIIQSTGARRDVTLELVNVDVRGAKNYLKDSFNYETLGTNKQIEIDELTETDCYRIMLKRNMQGFKSRATLIGSKERKIDIPDNADKLRNILYQHPVKIKLLTKTGYTTLIGTTNQRIVEKVYGKDYRIYCNSLNSRIKELYNKLKYYIGLRNEAMVQKLIKEDMYNIYGLVSTDVGYESGEPFGGIEIFMNHIETVVGTIRESTQKKDQIMITSLVDRKPKQGYGRNLLRSFYLDNVCEIYVIEK